MGRERLKKIILSQLFANINPDLVNLHLQAPILTSVTCQGGNHITVPAFTAESPEGNFLISALDTRPGGGIVTGKTTIPDGFMPVSVALEAGQELVIKHCELYKCQGGDSCALDRYTRRRTRSSSNSG